MNVDEFVEFCRTKCIRRKTCHYEGCILDEPKIFIFLTGVRDIREIYIPTKKVMGY